MDKYETAANQLHFLAEIFPDLSVTMPENGVRMPTGTFDLPDLLNYIANCLLENT